MLDAQLAVVSPQQNVSLFLFNPNSGCTQYPRCLAGTRECLRGLREPACAHNDFPSLGAQIPSCQPGFGKPGHGSALLLPNSLLWRPTPASSSGFELSHGSPISHGPRALHKNLHICSRVEFVLRAGGQDQLCGVTTKSLHMACSMAGEKGVPKHAKHSYFRVCAPWNPSCVPGRFCSLPGRGAMVSSASLVSQEPQPPVCHNLFSC